MDERERVLLTLAGVRVFMGVFWLVEPALAAADELRGGRVLGPAAHVRPGADARVLPAAAEPRRQRPCPAHDDRRLDRCSCSGSSPGLSLLLGLWTRVGAAARAPAGDRDHAARRQHAGRVALRVPHADPALEPHAAPAGLAPHEPRRCARPRSLTVVRPASGTRGYPEVMCGIAGFTIAPGVDLERTALAQAAARGHRRARHRRHRLRLPPP